MKRSTKMRSLVARSVEARAAKFSLLMKQGAVIGDPKRVAEDALTRTLAVAAVAVPAALFASLYMSLLGMVALVPVLVYFLPELRLRDKVSERREGVERELPFFSILVNVLGGAGMPLYQVFESIARAETFEAIRREALLVRRDVEIFGLNPLESFERVASYHPSGKFSDFLAGYTSKVRSGGDMPLYLGWQSGTLLRDLEDAWGRYAERAGVVGSLMVTAFGVVPLLLLTVGFFAPAASLDGLLGFALLGVPALAAIMISMAGRMQPTGDDPTDSGWKMAVLLSMVGAAPGLLLRTPWVAVAGGIFAFLLAYGLQARKTRKEREETEASLPRFLGDILEYKRQEYDLTKAILATAKTKYSQAFDRMLGKVSASLRAGVPLDEAKPEGGTRLSRLSFMVLGLMSRSGGGSVDAMFQLTQYASKVREMKTATRSEMRPYLMLSYLTPLMLVLGLVFVGGVLSNLGGPARPEGLGNVGGQGNLYGGLLGEVSNVLIVMTAAGLGLVGAKMTDFTVRNTLRAATNVLIATSAALVVPAISLTALLHLAV